MQVIITLGGKGQRFTDAGYSGPKPLVLVGAKPAIQYLIEAFPENWKLLFVIGEQFRTSDLEDSICNIRLGAEVLYVDYSERGPIDTVAAALPMLNLEEPVIVSYCDYTMLWDPQDFAEAVEDFDAAVVTCKGFHPTYYGPNSYCHLKVDGEKVLELQEKKLYTKSLQDEVTSVGLYYFKSVQFLSKALIMQLNQDLKYKTEYYTSLAIQAVLNEDKNARVLNFPITHMVQLGTPPDVQRFEYWYRNLITKNVLNKNVDVADYDQEKKYWQIVFEKIL